MDLRRITHPGPTENHKPLPSSGRAGRNLPAAIGVGVGLAALFLAVLFISNEAFVVLLWCWPCGSSQELLHGRIVRSCYR